MTLTSHRIRRSRRIHHIHHIPLIPIRLIRVRALVAVHVATATTPNTPLIHMTLRIIVSVAKKNSNSQIENTNKKEVLLRNYIKMLLKLFRNDMER